MRLERRHGTSALVMVGALLGSACADDTNPPWDGGPPASTGSLSTGGLAATSGPTAGSSTGSTASLDMTTGVTSATTATATGTTAGLTTGATTGPTSGLAMGTSTGQGTDTTASAPDAGTTSTTATDASTDAQLEPDGSPPQDAGQDGNGPVKPQDLWKFVGNITTRGEVRSDFIEYWDQLTPENEGKWESVERTRDQMNWAGLDAAYNYAKEHGIPFKQHTFVWGSQEPGWVAGLPAQEQREEVEEWIRLYCERYPDTQMIDVVNEPPPHKTPSYMNAIGGAGESGWDWIVQSFNWAHQYCPNAILILNDYNNIEYANDNAHFIDIVKRILAAGAPIDAVGVQAHDAHKLSTDAVRANIDRIANETGLPIYVSEYDISESDDERQRQIMASQFEMFWRNEHVVGITLWGYIEGATWLPNTGLMSTGGPKRPAMTWLMDFLEQER